MEHKAVFPQHLHKQLFFNVGFSQQIFGDVPITLTLHVVFTNEATINQITALQDQEGHLWKHNVWNLETDGPLQQKNGLGAARVGEEQKTEPTYAWARQSWTTEKWRMLSGDDESAVTFRWHGQNWCEQHESMDA